MLRKALRDPCDAKTETLRKVLSTGVKKHSFLLHEFCRAVYPLSPGVKQKVLRKGVKQKVLRKGVKERC